MDVYNFLSQRLGNGALEPKPWWLTDETVGENFELSSWNLETETLLYLG